MFSTSVQAMLRMMKNSYEESEKKLLDILVKTTFIENNLTVDGAQTAEQLFENLRLAQNNEATIPFSSPQDVAAFCDSMPLNFHNEAGKRYINTGVQGRRLVQWLKTQLELGVVVDEDCFDNIKERFWETIDVEESRRNFAKAEVGMDYPSLRFLGRKIPGLKYDKASGQLSLTEDSAKSLPLNIPIITDTINCAHPRKIDFSRKVTCFATNVQTDTALPKTEFLCQDGFDGVIAAFYRNTIEVQPATLDKAFHLITGYVRPNQKRAQIEIFSAEAVPFCALNNCSTKSSSDVIVLGTSHSLGFETADMSEKYQPQLMVSRRRVINKDEKLGKQDEDGKISNKD